MELNDQQTEMTNKTHIGMICEMHKDTAGRHLITLTYDTFHIVTGKNGDVQEISSLASSYDPAEKLLGSLKGISLTVILDSPGHILSITGSQEVVRTIMARMNGVDEHTAKQARDLVAKFAGESFIKNNMEQLFEALPDTAVYIGDTWTSKTSQSDDLPYESIATYTLTSVADGMAQVESASQISSGKENKTNLMGYDVSTNLRGEQSGSYEVEERTGRVVKSRTETDIKGTLELVGKTVPVRINTIRTIAARKI